MIDSLCVGWHSESSTLVKMGTLGYMIRAIETEVLQVLGKVLHDFLPRFLMRFLPLLNIYV